MNLEQLEVEVSRALEPAFRAQLLARGQARSLIWRDGVLPFGSPAFSESLSYDLVSYGDSLLLLALHIRNARGDERLARQAFNQAGEVFEAVVVNGDSSDSEQGFLRMLSAAAYHLGRSSARAYSMLNVSLTSSNLSSMELGLALLILRRLDHLEDDICQWRNSGRSSDNRLVSSLKAIYSGIEVDDATTQIEDSIFVALDHALCDRYFEGLGTYLLALQTGEAVLVERAREQLNTGLEVASEFNLVPQWWCLHLTIELIDDLWQASFHKNLPQTLPNGSSDTWDQLRSLFIATLYRRHRSEIELWPSQVEGARRAIDISDNLIVSLPTSAGKTRIAEFCILRCLAEGLRIVYITPLRALSAQTEHALRKTFSNLGKSVSALYGSMGMSVFDEDTLRSRDIVVATPEKLDFALRNDPSLFDDVGLVVLDEGHMIGLGEREIRYEVQIQRLLNRPDANKRRIVCLSAVFPTGEEFDDFVGWLRRDADGEAVRFNWRPTRLRFGEVLWRGQNARLELRVGEERPFVTRFIRQKAPKQGRRIKSFPKDIRELVVATAWQQFNEGHTVLIYCPERKSVNPYASEIVKLQSQGFIKSALCANEDELTPALTIGREWFGHEHPILKCLKLGVAIHHGALPTPFRKEIERLLRADVLKVTVSSPTLAQGLNLTATTIVMHDIQHFRRGRRRIIDASAFKNIVGRAGRAFVDLEGLVLYPIFNDEARKRAQWNKLLNDSADENLDSGLCRLANLLLYHLHKALEEPSLDELIDYVLNNATAWEYPYDDEEDSGDPVFTESQWDEHLATLDSALLSLVGEEDIEIDRLSTRLDELLASSLWERRLKYRREVVRESYQALLTGRAMFMWTKSSKRQRQGYFLAGVGLTAGQKLDELACELNPIILEAGEAIVYKDRDRAINAIENMAERLFKIKPFDPKPFPINWREGLKLWLRGESVSIENTKDDETMLFIENGLVYKLPWAIDAVRVRAGVNEETVVINDMVQAVSKFDSADLVSCLETGTLNVCAARLIQSGFASRLAAIKAATDANATFTNMRELKTWLQSPSVVSLSSNSNWPTPESHSLWQTFVRQSLTDTNSVWRVQKGKLPVIWHGNESPPEGEIVRLRCANNGECIVFSSSFEEIGKLENRLSRQPIGQFDTRVNGDGSLIVQYQGPNDFVIVP